MKREKKFQSELTRWIKQDGAKMYRRIGVKSCLYELKFVLGERLAKSLVKEHQVVDLAKAGGVEAFADSPLAHKLSDSAIGYKPVDGFWFFGGYAALIIAFRGGDEVLAVEADKVFEWWMNDKVRTMTLTEARLIGLVLRQNGKWVV